MIRILVKTIYFTLLFLIFLASIAIYLLATTEGLDTLIGFSRIYFPGTIKIKQLEGSLINHFTVGELEYRNKAIKVKIKQLDIQWQPHSLRESQLLTTKWDSLECETATDKILNSQKGTLTATGILPDLQINLNSQINTLPEDHWLLDAKIHGALPWQWTFNANLSQAQSAENKRTGLYTNLSTQGEITARNQGNLLLTIRPGFYHVPNNDSMPVVQFKGGSLKLILSPEKLKGSGFLTIDEHKNLKLEFQLPKFTLAEGLTDTQAIDGKLSLELSSLDFLQKISPEINKLKGQFLASITVNGTMNKPQIASQLILSKSSLSLPKLGLDINNLDINVYGKEKSWEATGSIVSAGHHLSLRGNGALSTQFTADLLVEGTDFPLIKTSEYQIHISPKLNLHLTPTTQSLTGTILIPYAEIKPKTFQNSISLPEDVVFKNKEQPSSFNVINSMDIAIEMGKEVAINMKGLKGHLDGVIHTKKIPQGSINAYGELSVRDGTYKAYGQDLTIQKGQLIFTGGPIDNPGISVRAAKKISTTPSTFSSTNQLMDFNSSTPQNFNYGEAMTLGVEVTGRLTHPKIQLFSDPAILSQADILSMLVLGRPASQANKAGAQLLLTAISSMSLGSGSNNLQLLEQLKQTAGIDLNVQTNTNYNQVTNTANDSTAVVVGKSLSKRLYLSYNIGLSQTDTNMLTLKYLLNKFFSIQVSSSDTSNAIDFLYTSQKKSKPKNSNPQKDQIS